MRGKGRPFQKGKAPGPGRTPDPPELKEARALTRTEAERLLNRFVFMTDAERTAAKDDPKTTALERIILAVIKRGIDMGDDRALTFLLDRLVGKVKEPDTNINLNLNTLPRAQVIELGREAVRFLEAKERKDDE